MDTPTALFRRTDRDRFEPTEAAGGSWDPTILHGAAVAALLAGQLEPAKGTLARLTVEFLAPMPTKPFTLRRTDPGGGSRVQRDRLDLDVDGRVVASATAMVFRANQIDLPAKALEDTSPFDPAGAPALTEPNRKAVDVVGFDSFASLGIAVERTRIDGDVRIHQWIGLTTEVVEGEPVRGVETAAAAADFAQASVHRQLPYTEWSYRNADLSLHLARTPVGRWVGVRSEALVRPTGAGFNTADLFDEAGWMGRSAAAVVVEPRG